MKNYVKCFFSDDEDELENDINDWLKSSVKNIIILHIAQSMDSSYGTSTIIVYKEE